MMGWILFVIALVVIAILLQRRGSQTQATRGRHQAEPGRTISQPLAPGQAMARLPAIGTIAFGAGYLMASKSAAAHNMNIVAIEEPGLLPFDEQKLEGVAAPEYKQPDDFDDFGSFDDFGDGF